MGERQEHDFTGTELRHVVVRGADVRGGGFADCRLRGVDVWNLDIHADLQNVRINGVDIAPWFEAELNRRDPERAKMRPETPEGFREAWRIVERRWAETVELSSNVTRTEPGWPQLEEFPLKECPVIVLNEEWQHRLYAECDLTALAPA